MICVRTTLHISSFDIRPVQADVFSSVLDCRNSTAARSPCAVVFALGHLVAGGADRWSAILSALCRCISLFKLNPRRGGPGDESQFFGLFVDQVAHGIAGVAA